MKQFAIASSLLALLLLPACGARAPLTPKPGVALPVKPAAARTVPDAERLIAPDTQARPERTDDPLQQSNTRTPDRFDLPPPG